MMRGIVMIRVALGLRSVTNKDGTVILDIEHDTMMTLNSTGSFVWDRLNQGQDIDNISRELAAETDSDLIQVERDLRIFVDELIEKQVLES
jgi:hypothetical protein